MNRINEFLDSLTLLSVFLLSFGSYSITRLIVTDGFPLFAKPREWVKERFPPEGYTSKTKPPRGKANRPGGGNTWYVYEGHWIGDLIDCPWCAGWWVGLGTLTAYWFQPAVTLLVLTPLALRAVIGVIANKLGDG